MPETKDLDTSLEAREGLLSGNASSSELGTSSSIANNHTRQEMYKPEGESRAKMDRLAGSVVAGSVAFLVGITWFMVLMRSPGSLGWFVLHPILQTLSLALFTYGILTLQPTSHADPRGKQAGLNRHQYTMFLLAFPVILVGTWAVWHNKEVKNAKHYQTWHATFGGLCLMWMIGQIVLGAGSVWFSGKLFGGGMKAKALWKYHRLSGYVLFPLLLFTAHLGGTWSDWATKNSVWAIRFLAFTVAPLLVVGGVYARARASKMKFR